MAWEYKTLNTGLSSSHGHGENELNERITGLLNSHGIDRWELVSTVAVPTRSDYPRCLLIMKRELLPCSV